MTGEMTASPDNPYSVRSFRPCDLPACRRLYGEGLIGGKLAENDTGFDIDDIESVYMKRPGNHFWVAVAPAGQTSNGAEIVAAAGDPQSWPVVGMVGVQHHEAGVGEIRRLRVAHTHRRRGIGSALMEAALRFCEERQYLKITLDTFMEREPAVKLFQKFRFRHDHTRKVGDKELMYFYLDLYIGDERRRNQRWDLKQEDARRQDLR
jgi:ribosomal protein S18 acetylase RimI-like enzyme